MEVTKKNFRTLLPELQKTVDDATFFSIDTEFTGLQRKVSDDQYASPAEYYIKLNERTDGFIVIQFGLTAFFVDSNAKDNPDAPIKYKSYTFYLYPRSPNQQFTCQGEAIAFLASHNFDFNKLFVDGISYSDLEEANRLREKFEANELQTYEQNDVLVPEEEKDALAQITEDVQSFLTSNQKELVIEQCNAFRRKLVYQLLEQKFADQVSASTRALPNSHMKVLVVERKKTQEELNKILEEKRSKQNDEMFDTIGFTQFLEMLSNSKKLIVGHNMLYDILYSMRQFFNPELKTLKEFKKATHKIFPNLLDTKYMCTHEQLKSKIHSSVLGDILESVSKKPFRLPDIEPLADDCSFVGNTNKEHDAGYDSYMTGLVFIGMALHLNISPSEMNARTPKLKDLINRLFIFRLADICYISLTGNEPNPPRDHVFHITVPEGWRHNNVMHHFRNFGAVYTSWLSPNSAYVALQNREFSHVIEKSIDKPDGFTIMSFKAYQIVKNAVTADKDVATKRKVNTDEEETTHESKKKKLTKKQKRMARKEQLFPLDDNWP